MALSKGVRCLLQEYEYRKDLIEIMDLHINVRDLIFTVMEYSISLEELVEYSINSSLGKAKYYVEKLKYTDTAITSLSKMQTEHIAAKKFENSLFFNIYQAI